MKLDISGYDTSCPPMTQARLNMIESNRSRHEWFIIDYYDKFLEENGWRVDYAWEKYKEFCKDKCFENIGSEPTFRNNMKQYCMTDKNGRLKRPALGKDSSGKLIRKECFVLLDEYVQKFKDED